MNYSGSMITVTIREAALKRGNANPAELSRDVGVSKPAAARLWAGEPLPKLATLDKICGAWGCDLKELIQYVPNGKKRRRAKE